jgi:hypothetical protein
MGNTIRLHLRPDYDRSLLPVPAASKREWFQSDPKTRNHAHHCQPLLMANSCGYFILSPARFTVAWDGDPDRDAELTIHECASHGVVDTHSSRGSFTIQSRFLARTENVGDFLWIKGIANERDLPFTCMEALVESWWSNAQFGLVFLLNGSGSFTVEMGQPIAQMLVYQAAGGFAELEICESLPEEHHAFIRRRTRPDFRKDLDYLRGRHPDGSVETTHIVTWRKGAKEQE